MKVTVELKTNNGITQYTMFEDAYRVYLSPQTNGISFQQDNDLPGYCITEGVILGGENKADEEKADEEKEDGDD